jgi:nitrogen fixation protein FixH
MRVRPFFWLLLITVCTGLLLFAGLITINQTSTLQIQIKQTVTPAAKVALVHLYLTDSNDQPIDQATILPNASMPTMYMQPQNINMQRLGEGNYQVRFQLSMAGMWQLTFQISAPGFPAAYPHLLVQVS